MVESSLEFDPEVKEPLTRRIMVQRDLPDFGLEVRTVSTADGC